MSDAVTPQPSPSDKLQKQINKLNLLVFFLAFLLICSMTGLLLIGKRSLEAIKKQQEDSNFGQSVFAYNEQTDSVQPTVNTMQFLHRGYSITFDRVEYTQNGLLLAGSIGNPTQLWISSLALNFTARPEPYKARDKILNNEFYLYSNAMNIGAAQTTVGVLNPGSTAPFEVTIPNVKQTSDSIEIGVSFSGERYQYLGR